LKGKPLNFKNVAATTGLVIASAIVLAGCSATTTTATSSTATSTAAAVDYSALSGTITAGGSSAQANAQAAWSTAFTAQATNVVVNYDKSQGSGGGVTNWTAGSYDFAGSDSPLKTEQQTAAATLCGPTGAINLPIYLDGVAIVFNLAGVTNLNLTADTLAKIFALQITTWNDPAIVAENPTATLPATAITTVTRSDGSGTTATFTNYLSAVAPSVWTNAPGSAWPIAGTSAQKGTSGIVSAVTAGEGTIGYADHSAIGTLTSASIETAKGSFAPFSVDGTSAAFAAAATTVTSTVAGDLAQKVDFAKITGADMYAIPLVSYGILCTTFPTTAQAELTKAYLGFIGSATGQAVAAKNAGAAQIPANLLAEIQTSLALIK
jgi:phosphate transport system substrate-binding protein